MGVSYNLNWVLFVLGLGSSLQGLETSSMALFIGSDQFNGYFDNPGSWEQGLIAGSNPVGAFVACLFSGVLSERLGRKFSLQFASVFWIVGSLIAIFVQNIYMIIGARLLKGICIGVCSAVLPVYITELFPSNKKGVATSTLQLFLTMGIMVMFYLSCICVFLDGALSFRIAWGVESIPGLLLFAFSFTVPETPKWYVSNLKHNKAEEVYQHLKSAARAKKLASNKINSVEDDFTEIESVVNKRESQFSKCSYSQLFGKLLNKHLLIGVLTQTFTQLSGIGVLMYYLIYICEMIGLEGTPKIVAASIPYVLNVLFTVFPILWLDKLRRKDVLIFGITSLGICLTALGAVMGFYGHSIPPLNGNETIVWEIKGTAGSICLSLCYLFVSIFASTLSCAAWLYTSEIFPIRAKSKGSAVCMSVSWTFSFLQTFLAPILLKYIKYNTFFMFGGCCFIGALVMTLYFPETYGLKEEQINTLFGLVLVDREASQKGGRILLIDEEKGADGDEESNEEDHSNQQEECIDNIQSNTRITPKRKYETVEIGNLARLRNEGKPDLIKAPGSPKNAYSSVGVGVGVSPFLKSMGGPLDLSSQSSEILQPKTLKSSHYYDNSRDVSPFLNQYQASSTASL